MIKAMIITIHREEKSSQIIPINAPDQIQVDIARKRHIFSNQIQVKTIRTIDAIKRANG